MNEHDERATSKKEILAIVLISAIGVMLSVASFLLYYNVKHLFVVIGICVIDIVYSYFNAKWFFFKSKEWNGARQLLIPLFMIVYWAVIFGIVCIGNVTLFNGEFSKHFLLYPIFLMPGFVLEIFILAFVLSGM